MDGDLERISRIISSVSALQVIKMSYFVFLSNFDIEESIKRDMSFEEAMEGSLEKIHEVDQITETAEETVMKLINRVDKQWELKVERYGSFGVYLKRSGVKVDQVSIDKQKAISYQISGKSMTVKQMLDIVG